MQKLPARVPRGNAGQLNLFPNGVLGFVAGAILDVMDGATGGIFNLDELGDRFRGTEKAAEQAQNTANGAAQSVVNVRKEVIQKIVAFDIKSPTPLYVALNRTEWPSIPWSEAFKTQPADSVSSTNLGDSGTTNLGQHRHSIGSGATLTGFESLGNHAHSLGSHSHSIPVTAVNEKMMTGALQRYAFIVIPVDTPLSGLNFYARGVPTDLRTRVYLMAPTGDLTALTPESGNLASLLVSTTHTATPVAFNDVIVEAGSIVVVRFSVVGAVYLMGDQKVYVEPPAGFYPKHLSATTASASGSPAPSSVSESAMTWSEGFVPYVAVGNNIIVTPTKRYLSDNYDRDDTSDARNGLGRSWSRAQTGMGLINLTDGVKVYQNAIVWRGAGDGSAEHTWSTALTTDKVLGRIHIGTPAATAWSRALVRKGSDTGIGIGFRQGSITIDVRSGFNSYATAITASRTLAFNDLIEYQIGTDANPNEIYVWHNGFEVIHTTGVTAPIGPGKRYCGVFLQRTPNNNSTAILDWETYDIPDVEPTP